MLTENFNICASGQAAQARSAHPDDGAHALTMCHLIDFLRDRDSATRGRAGVRTSGMQPPLLLGILGSFKRIADIH